MLPGEPLTVALSVAFCPKAVDDAASAIVVVVVVVVVGGGFVTSTALVVIPAYVALIVTEVAVETALVVPANWALELPAGTVTLEGTEAAAA